MAEEDDTDKTEDPSSRKLSQAREKGQVAISQDIKTWMGLVGVTVVVGMLAPRIGRDLLPVLRRLIEFAHDIPLDSLALRNLIISLSIDIMLALIVTFGMFITIGVVATVGQAGFLFSWSKLAPDFNKVNPIAGLGRIFSTQSVLELVKGTIKIVLIGWLLGTLLWPKRSIIIQLPELEMIALLKLLQSVLLSMLAAVLVAFFVISAGDFGYQRWNFMKKMRMTKQEVRDEHKQMEGDPMIKARMRSMRRERARQRMMAAVPKSTVVVTNPTHYAVALKYEMETMDAPILVAKGVELVALRIRELAQEHDVPIVENPPLARALYATVELEQEVPQEHYKAVAEVIGYVMRLKGTLKN
jgi:flagellar biosynthetic protein FlhB